MAAIERLGAHVESAFQTLTGRRLSDLTREELSEDLNQRREQVWHAACRAGLCRYAVLPKNVSDEPPWVDATTTCGGYHGVSYFEPRENGPPMHYWRWRPCMRQIAWAKAKAALKAAERGKHKAAIGAQSPKQLPPPDGWRDHGRDE